jgi:hypothetical protein
MAEPMIPVPHQVRRQNQEHPHIPLARDVQKRIMLMYIVVESVKTARNEKVKQPLGDPDRKIGYRVFVVEEVRPPAFPGGEVLKAQKNEECRYDKSSCVHEHDG